jgi:hypothetical protein
MFYELPIGNCSNDEMIEKNKIRELIEFERYCRDYSYFEQERACWWDDGQVFATWFKGSVDDFLNCSIAKNKSPSCHKINNTIVWMNGDKAIAECLCMITFRTKLGYEPVDLHSWCRLHYRVEKRDDKWGILYFEGIYEKDRIDPVFSDSRWFVPREELTKFRPINWNMCFRLTNYAADSHGRGIENSEEWCGVDKPETIRKLYEESSIWMGLE